MSRILDSISPDVKQNLKDKYPTIIIGSLTLVAGLAWNDGFTALIDQYVPDKYKKGNNAWFKILYASVLTFIIVILITVILKFVPSS
jgi:hypothetical protein